MSNHERLLWETSKIWCPDVGEDHPRRASTATSYQEPVLSRYELVTSLLDAMEAGQPGFVSTYSFPRGHTDNGTNIPKIDTIFVDFDIPPDSEYRQRNPTLDAWKRSMSDLLVRVQMVANSLLESGKAKHWRASLSGSKGVHLFFDFHEIHPNYGSYTQFKRGLSKYGDGMIERLDELSGGINIDPWVDVDSSDLARLVRHPNTPHPGAEHVDESWCVPVSIEELSDMTPETYLELTSGPRELPEGCDRVPSKEATKEIGTTISNAGGGEWDSSTGTSVKDPKKLNEYREESNDKISVSDIPLLVGNKPCIMGFVERSDAFHHGASSRTMEIQVIKELVKEQHRVPIETIVDFFRVIDGFDEDYTRDLVEDLISRYDGPFVCENVWEEAPQFCTAMNDGSCGVYDRNEATNT